MSVLNKTLKGLEQRQASESNELTQEQTVVVKPVRDLGEKLHKLAIPVLVIVALGLTAYVVYKKGIITSVLSGKENGKVSISTTPPLAHKKIEAASEKSTENSQKIVLEQQLEKQQETPKEVVYTTETSPLSNAIVVAQPEQDKALSTNSNKPDLPSQPVTTKQQTQSKTPTEPSMKDIAVVSAKQKAQEFFQAGKKAFTFGMVSEAIAELQQCIVVLPEHIECRSLLAAAYYGRKDITKASDVLEQGLSLRPASIEWRTLLAKIYADNKQYQEVLSVLPQQFESLGGNDFWILKGLAAQQLSQHEVALRSFKKLTLAEPQQGKWWMAMGRSAEQLKQWQNAVQYYTTATQIGNLSPASQRFAVERLQFLRGQVDAS